MLVLWRNFINSASDGAKPQKTHESKFSLKEEMVLLLGQQYDLSPHKEGNFLVASFMLNIGSPYK